MEKNKQQNSNMDGQWIQKLAKSKVQLNIRLTNDFAFKKAFHNVKAMKGLLSAFLEIDAKEIQSIEFVDTLLQGEYQDGKEGILDLRVHLNGNRRINIEMQVKFFPYWKERSLFYLSKMYIDGFYKGQGYDNLEECIHIGILQFQLVENLPLYSKIELWDRKNNRSYSDKISLRVLELSQLEQADEEEKRSDVYKWAKLISAEDWEVLNMLAKDNEYMQAAKEELEKINSDEAMRYAYLLEEMRVADEVTLRRYYERQIQAAEEKAETVKSEGRKEGIKEGETRFGQLCMRLLKEERIEALEKAATDEEYRLNLYKEYKL